MSIAIEGVYFDRRSSRSSSTIDRKKAEAFDLAVQWSLVFCGIWLTRHSPNQHRGGIGQAPEAGRSRGYSCTEALGDSSLSSPSRTQGPAKAIVVAVPVGRIVASGKGWVEIEADDDI
ncbi:hypothetical protein C8F04DRAFT_1230861 [Mycena alexandri]|uniref:Uncharacterized protein n=1 Tax=Mycena alexandri TaxID=1745969 RepID=A0AAD6X9M7_9AGAR|nr:hypothetical protein C8F04DRAFT_1230861 [Mycena alexandri]